MRMARPVSVSRLTASWILRSFASANVYLRVRQSVRCVANTPVSATYDESLILYPLVGYLSSLPILDWCPRQDLNLRNLRTLWWSHVVDHSPSGIHFWVATPNTCCGSVPNARHPLGQVVSVVGLEPTCVASHLVHTVTCVRTDMVEMGGIEPPSETRRTT